MKAALTSFTAPSDPVPTPRPERMSAEQAASVSANAFAGLMEHLGYLDATSIEQVRQAYRFADEAHLGQLRNSGEPYITHPIAVAAQCATWKLDAQALMAALLHDAMEDCGVTKMELIERFGSPVAELVDGLTKLDKLEFNTKYFRSKMTEAGFDIKPGDHPIVPIMLYDAVLAQTFAKELLEENIYVVGFFFPVVPKGLARIRVQISAAHTKEDLDKAIAGFEKIGKKLGVIK